MELGGIFFLWDLIISRVDDAHEPSHGWLDWIRDLLLIFRVISGCFVVGENSLTFFPLEFFVGI